MDSWILKGVKNLVDENRSVNVTSPTQVKVKISYLLLTEFDEMLYKGDIPISYPKIPGRAAVGIVTEAGENCYGLQKGTRVYLEPTRACGNCLNCKSGKHKECTSYISAGKDFDGFLQDFVVCENNQVSVLPDSVDDFHALCIEYVGIAENIYDKLNLSAGQRVAIIGGDPAGLITAQVLLYHKVIPIVIDNNPENLDRAKKCGIFYTFPADDDFAEHISSATSGNLCDAAIYCATSKLPLSFAARLVRHGAQVAISCNSVVTATMPASDILNKNLTVFGVSTAYNYTDAAINMLVHNAINIENFEKQVLTDYDPAKILADSTQCPSAKRSRMTIFKMIL